jgi:hypothetical protein
MTNGEKMVWAAAYARSFEDHQSAPAAAEYAAWVIIQMREDAAKVAHAFGGEDEVTIMFNEMTTDTTKESDNG